MARADIPRWLKTGPVLAALLCVAPAHADDDANAYAEQSLVAAEEMYLGTDFEGADEVLRAAIAQCGADACKRKLAVKLNVFHAEVLVSGLKKREAAKQAMQRALELDRDLELDAAVDSKALFEIHAEALEELGEADDDDDADDDDQPEAAPKPVQLDQPEEDEDDIRRNWIRATFMLDLSLLFAESDVCSASGQDARGWVCARVDDTLYRGVPSAGQQNAVSTGMRLSTMRVALGYERVLGESFTLGLRAGIAFRPILNGNADDFIPAHAEARAAYWFGSAPFESVVRPNLSLVGGFGSVISFSELTVLEDGTACAAVEPISGDCTVPTDPSRDTPELRVQRLRANKTAGPGFAGLGFGLSFSPTPVMMIDLGARVTATFPVFSLLLTPEAGLSFGF